MAFLLHQPNTELTALNGVGRVEEVMVLLGGSQRHHIQWLHLVVFRFLVFGFFLFRGGCGFWFVRKALLQLHVVRGLLMATAKRKCVVRKASVVQHV